MPQPTGRSHSSAGIPWYWQKINLFEGTEPGVREAFVKSAEQLQFRRGQHVFRADDLATRVFFLESGMIRIYHLSANGCVIIFWFCSPGDLFGAGGISGSLDQSVYGQAVEPSTVFMIPRSRFEDLLIAHPQLAINVIRLMGGRLRLACDAMVDKVSLCTESRLARLLLRLAENWGRPSGEGVELKVRISHQELANMIGTCRQTVNMILHEFLKEGIIEFRGRIIYIAAPQRLKAQTDIR